MTKTEANYQLPEKCCTKCANVYQSIYGDVQCRLLEAGNVVDLGGICVGFIPAVGGFVIDVDNHNANREARNKRTAVLEDNANDTKCCANCMYSTDDNSNGPICILTGKHIGPNDKCRKWELADEPNEPGHSIPDNDGGMDSADVLGNAEIEDELEYATEEQPLHGNCSSCNHSYYDNDSIPRCSLCGEEIEADDSCDNWQSAVVSDADDADDNEQPPPDHNCYSCRHSFYGDTDGLPYCRLSCTEIEDIETPCYDWEGEEDET